MRPSVSLVIPGKNCARTLAQCLSALQVIRDAGQLDDVVFANDHSEDDSVRIAESFDVRIVDSAGSGPGAARNAGYRSVHTDLVWFIDSDCVTEPDALSLLLPYMEKPEIAGVGGSYGNAESGSLLARLIHEEIIERHLRMPERVNFLASFNVLYRRSVLEEVGGFSENLPLAQDAELAFRIKALGKELQFNKKSKVHHYHPTGLLPYLKKQFRHGISRIHLYQLHPSRLAGDSYSDLTDHFQPVMALLLIAFFAFGILVEDFSLLLLGLVLLSLLPLPMAIRMTRRCGLENLYYVPFSMIRAFPRGVGIIAGVAYALIRASTDRKIDRGV